ncbi:unnamed protein product [Parajaminaea phylloscopi]
MARQIAPTPHLIWAAGHLLTLVCGARYIFGSLLFNSSPTLSRWYTVAYLGALVSYGVVVYNRFGVPQVSRAWLQRAVMEENVQYLFLALYWWINKPIFLTLVPFVTFSLVHTLNFVSKVVIPYAFPGTASAASSPSPAAGGPKPSGSSSSSSSAAPPTTLPGQASKQIQSWIRNNYEHCMKLVSYSEVVLFVRLLLGAVLLRNSLLAPLIFAHFLRLRFFLSSFTRSAWQSVGASLDRQTSRPECPPVVRRAYLTVVDLISRYASTVMSVPHGQGASPAAGAAGTGPAVGNGAEANARR